jgi:hypothetical protein
VSHPEETTMTARALADRMPADRVPDVTRHLLARLFAYIAWMALALLAAL